MNERIFYNFIMLLITALFLTIVIRALWDKLFHARNNAPSQPIEDACTPPDFKPDQDPDWMSVGVFPADFRSIQPFGAHFVGPSYGRNERYLKYQNLISFLSEQKIPFHMQDVNTSMFNAVEVFIPKEFENDARKAMD